MRISNCYHPIPYFRLARAATCFALIIGCFFLFFFLRSERQSGNVETEESLSVDNVTAVSGSTQIIFEGRRYTYDGAAEDISADGGILTIRAGGNYRISGKLTDGNLVIDAGMTAPVRLILDNAELSSLFGTPILVKSAACLILETKEGSVNLISDHREDTPSDDHPSCILASCPLIMGGSGSLNLSAKRSFAIFCTESVSLLSGNVTLSAPHTALFANSSFLQSDGRLCITEAIYGIAIGNDPFVDSSITVSSGSLAISCSNTALIAPRAIVLTSPDITFFCPNIKDVRDAGETVLGKLF